MLFRSVFVRFYEAGGAACVSVVTIAGHTITAQPQITAEAADIITAVQLPGH